MTSSLYQLPPWFVGGVLVAAVVEEIGRASLCDARWTGTPTDSQQADPPAPVPTPALGLKARATTLGLVSIRIEVLIFYCMNNAHSE